MKLLLIIPSNQKHKTGGFFCLFQKGVKEICHFTDEKVEGQRNEVVSPMLHSEAGAKLGLAPQILILNLFIAFSNTLHWCFWEIAEFHQVNSYVETFTFPKNSKISLSQNHWKNGQVELGETFELFSETLRFFLSRPCSKLEQITTKWGQAEVLLNLLEGTSRNNL